jgi:hypothetical protein
LTRGQTGFSSAVVKSNEQSGAVSRHATLGTCMGAMARSFAAIVGRHAKAHQGPVSIHCLHKDSTLAA